MATSKKRAGDDIVSNINEIESRVRDNEFRSETPEVQEQYRTEGQEVGRGAVSTENLGFIAEIISENDLTLVPGEEGSVRIIGDLVVGGEVIGVQGAQTFAQPDEPTGLGPHDEGALWADTDDRNHLYRWSGSEWVSMRDGLIQDVFDGVIDLEERVEDLVPHYPVAPTNLTGTTTAAWDSRGVMALANVTLSWDAVTKNTDNTASTPEYYEIEAAPVSTGTFSVVARTATTSGTASGLTISTQYNFRVRAFNSSAEPGTYSNLYAITTTFPSVPMLAPSAPSLTSSLGTIVVSWDGLLGTSAPPNHFRYVYAEVSSNGGASYTRSGSPFMADTRSITLTGPFTVGSTYQVRLVAVDGVGIKSPASTAASIVVQGIDGAALVQEINDKIEEASNNSSQAIEDLQSLDTRLAELDAPGAILDQMRNSIQAAQDTADGLIQRHYSENPPWPNESSQPASKVGDLWLKTSTATAYRWTGTTWDEIPGDDVAVALREAREAQDAAEDAMAAATQARNRVVTFYSPSEPTGIDVVEGVLWIDTDAPASDRLKRRVGTRWVSVTDDVLRKALDGIQTLDDTKISTHIGTTAPSDLTASDIGDLWLDTSDKNHLKRWSGSAWVSLRDGTINDALVRAGSKSTTYYQSTAPTSPSAGDFWIDTATAARKLKRYSDSAWVDVTDDVLKSALNAAGTAQATADGKVRTFAQTTAPTDLAAKDVGDLWLDTDDKNKMYRWDGDSWEEVRDTDIALALSTASQAAKEAAGKITTFYVAAQPTATGVGDLWVKTDAVPNQLRRWNGSTWEVVTDSILLKAYINASDAQATADKKIQTFAQNDPPANNAANDLSVGDIWLDTNDGNKMHRWDGDSWEVFQDRGITEAQMSAEEAARAARDAAGLAGAKGKTWTQPTQPPTEKTYRWVGTANSSATIERLNGVETRRNLAVDPTYATASSAFPNNSAVHTVTRNVAVVDHPQGITTAVRSTPATGQTVGALASFYNMHGLQAVNPAGFLGVWAYSNVAADAWWFNDGQAKAVRLQPFQWTWVPAQAKNTANTHASFFVNKAGGGVAAPGTEYALVTGVAYEDAAPPKDTIWGGRPDDRANDLWIDTKDGKNVPKVWNGVEWVAVHDATINEKLAQISSGGVNAFFGRDIASFQRPASGIQNNLVIQTSVPSTAQMVQMRITGYNYSSTEANIDLAIQAYAYTTSLISRRTVESRGALTPTVRYALNANNRLAIILSPPAGGWQYPVLKVSEATVSYTGSTAAMLEGWTISEVAESSIAGTFPYIFTPESARDALREASTALTSANGKNNVIYSTLPATGTKNPDTQAPNVKGDVWFQQGTADGVSGIIGQWQWTGSSWVQVSVTHEVIASLDLGNLTVVGKLSGNHIEANSIAVDKLLISDTTNLLENPEVRGTVGQFPAGWSRNAAVIATSTEVSGQVLHFTATNTPWVNNNLILPIVPNADGTMPSFFFQMRGRNDKVGGLGLSAEVEFAAVENFSTVLRRESARIPGTTDTSWHTVSGTATAPAGARWMRFRVVAYDRATSPVGEAWAGNFILRRQSGATLIEDGAITTDKIYAGAVTTKALAANAVNAEKVLISDFTNLIEGADFPGPRTAITASEDTSVPGWLLGSGSAVIQNTAGLPGRALYFSAVGEASVWNSRYFEVAPRVDMNGAVVMPEFYAQATYRNDRAQPGIIAVQWYDQNKNPIAESAGGISEMLLNTTPGTTWLTPSAIFGAGGIAGPPTNARYGRLKVEAVALAGTTTAGLWVGRVVLRQMGGGELIVDGSIYGRHIQSESMETRHFRAESINGNIIEAGTIRAGAIDPLYGQSIDLNGNVTINAVKKQISDQGEEIAETLGDIPNVYRFEGDAAKIAKPTNPYQVWIYNDKIEIRVNDEPVSTWTESQMQVTEFKGTRVALANHEMSTYLGAGGGTIIRALSA